MENIKQIITAIMNHPQVIAIISGLVTYLLTNLLVIILFAVKYIKLKGIELSNKQNVDESQKAILRDVNARLDKIEEAILGKIDEQDLARKQKAKETAEQLQAAVEATRASINQTLKK